MEFKDEPLTVMEYLAEQPELFRSQMNSWIKLMAKRCDTCFMDFQKMDLAEFMGYFQQFLKKYGLDTKFNFLGK